MINYFPIQLFYFSSALMFLALLTRVEISIYFICLIINAFINTISILLIKKNLLFILVLHKCSTIAWIICLNFQNTFTYNPVVLIYLITEMQPTLLIIQRKKIFLNCSYLVYLSTTVMTIINQESLNEAILILLHSILYLFTTLPQNFLKRPSQNKNQYLKPHQRILDGIPFTPSKDFQQYSAKIDSSRSNGPASKRSAQSFELSHRFADKASEQLSIELIPQFSSIGQNSDKIWKERLMSFPVGILLINRHTKEIIYTNQFLKKLLFKTLNIQEYQYQQYLLHTLKFKVLDQGDQKRSQFSQYLSLKQSRPNIEIPRVSTQQHMKCSGKLKNNTSIEREEIETHHPKKTYTFSQIITKIQDNYFEGYVNEQDHTLELYCKVQTVSVTIHLNMKVLYSPDSVEMTVIMQDYSRYNELSRMEELEKFKSKMINSFSHELRTPLNSASLFFKSAILDERLDISVRERYIVPGLSCLMRQTHLINDIIDFSQVNANQLELRFNEFSITNLIQQLTQLFKFEFESKKLGLAFQVGEGIPDLIRSDYQRLLQILVNVIQNALKYSSRGYTLIKIKYLRNFLNFEVIDEGNGIEYRKLRQIQQVLKDYHTYQDGWNGFGLIISQMLLRYLGPFRQDDLQINSEGLGTGTIVKFNVVNYEEIDIDLCDKKEQFEDPLRRIKTAPNLGTKSGLYLKIKSKTRSSLIHKVTNEKINAIDDFMTRQQCTPQLIQELNAFNWLKNSDTYKNQTTYHQCKCSTILSVDDEIFNQESLKCILQKLDFQVDFAFNGQQALEMINQKKECGPGCKKYLFILMDCQMPIMDGWQTTKILISKFHSHQLVQIPIIGFTAFTNKSDIDLCRQVGMDDVLNKPLEVKRLKQIIQRLQLT